MSTTQNPFRYGVLGANDLIDRVAETAKVEAAIRNGDKLFMIGPRRFGKTSILRTVEERMTAEGAIILRMNAEAYPTIEVLVERIVTTAAARLKGKVERVAEEVGRFFAKLRPIVKYNAVENAWSVGLDTAQFGEYHPAQLLVDVLNGLEKLALAQSKKVAVGLIIDEFQNVILRGGEATEGQIRAVVQEHSRVGYVFAGSQTRTMTDMTTDHDRPFYRLGDSLSIGTLPRKDFAAHLARQYRKSGFTVKDQAAIDSILDLAEEVPYNVQLLAHNCWDELRGLKPGKAVLTNALVKTVLTQTVDGLDPLFTQTWNKLTVAQQQSLIAVIKKQGVGIHSSATAKEFGISVATIQGAIRSLHEQSILRDDPAKGKVRMRFEDPFFAHWIKLTAMK